MSDRTTGATPAQIEAGAKSFFEADSPLAARGWKNVSECHRDRRRKRVEQLAPHLVPPDHRIVSVADLREVIAHLDDLADYDDAPELERTVQRLSEIANG